VGRRRDERLGDDFGLNDAGIIVTETTIGGFFGHDPSGVPEFVRARKAMQYAASIDDVGRFMKDGNNGGYANDWLIADIRRNLIGHLELGLRNVTLETTTDGYFVGANFPKILLPPGAFSPTTSIRTPGRRIRTSGRCAGTWTSPPEVRRAGCRLTESPARCRTR